MITDQHKQHIRSRVSHNDCQECRADTERRFVQTAPWNYDHMRAYLDYVKPRLAAIKAGENSADSHIWMQKFRVALDRRITLKVSASKAERKRCDSYLERMGQFGKNVNGQYLRQFSARGASCLT